MADGKPEHVVHRPSITHCLVWLVVAAMLMSAGCSQPPEVDVVAVERGTLEESFSEPARTRLPHVWTVSMPLDGRIGRIALEPGDVVEVGVELADFDERPLLIDREEILAAIEELRAEIAVKDDDRLELTGLINTLALVESTSETLKASQASVDAQAARLERSQKELERLLELAASQTIPDTRLDDARLLAETDLIELRERQYGLASNMALAVAVNLGPRFINDWLQRKRLERNVLMHRMEQQRIRLDRANYHLRLSRIAAPAPGTILERLHDGDAFLAAGTPLLSLGNLDDLEVEADVLTEDALRLEVGGEVWLQQALRGEAFPGRVLRIEPQAFTKLSSLGVEQQRVRVLVRPENTPATLGVGYRLQARFITGRSQQALLLPRFAVVEMPGGQPAVFVVRGNTLHQQPVRLGLRGDSRLEVAEGLDAGDLVVANPDTSLRPGQRVRPRR